MSILTFLAIFAKKASKVIISIFSEIEDSSRKMRGSEIWGGVLKVDLVLP